MGTDRRHRRSGQSGSGTGSGGEGGTLPEGYVAINQDRPLAQVQPNVIALDHVRVLWRKGNGEIRSVPIAGGGDSTHAIGVLPGKGLASDGTHVYWTEAEAGGDGAGGAGGAGAGGAGGGDVAKGRVMRVGLASVGTPEVFADDQELTYGVAVDDNTVYWSCPGDGTVRRADK